jgi:hypothetical protein
MLLIITQLKSEKQSHKAPDENYSRAQKKNNKLSVEQKISYATKCAASASFSCVAKGIGFVGAGRRPMLSTLSPCFGGGRAAFGNNRPFFSNHSGLSNALNPSLL